MDVLVARDTRQYCVAVTLEEWPVRVTKTVAREVRRYRDERKLSAQQLEERTAEFGMRIPRSVLANLESGRREVVSPAEVVVLAAALGVAPVELLSPVGFDQQVEMLPGRMMDPLSAMRWFTGELKLETDGPVTRLREPGPAEQSSTYLAEYHDNLISDLRKREANAARAIADAAAEGEDESALKAASIQVSLVDEYREFAWQLLRRTRAEMRERGMVPPELPPDIKIEESDA